MPFDHIQFFDHDFAVTPMNREHLSRFAALLPGDHDDGIALADSTFVDGQSRHRSPPRT
jgi:hypothetical protein